MTIMEDKEKPRTILVGNIPRETQKREIEQVFGEMGQLKRCYIQYPRGDKKQGDGNKLLCYITYAFPEDAAKALENLSNHKFGKSKIHIKFTKTRSDQVRPQQSEEGAASSTLTGTRNKRRIQKETPTVVEGDENLETENKFKNPNMIPLGEVVKSVKVKTPRVKTENKKPRLIVRNLSFKVTEDKIRDYFKDCGKIKDVNVLRKPDGNLVGCAFVQFETVREASKAVRDLNLKPFLGRPIAIDWALPKKDFQGIKEQELKQEAETKVEGDDEEVKIKLEPGDVDVDDNEVEFVNPYESMDVDIKEEKPDLTDASIRKRKIKKESDDDVDNEKSVKRTRNSNDVEEGKTLFLRNLDFNVTEDDLKEFFEVYGQLHYALLCKDRLTEHPKGTGFVKFKNLADATKCLTDFNIESPKFTLHNRLFSITLAVAKENLSNSGNQDDKKEKIKHDNRNLYLVREGFIRPGSGSAVGVSAADMNKRAALNSTKKQMLKNLNIFVSPTRLCVHNLPVKLSDKTLRKIFKQHSPPEVRITEARIMRDMKDIQLGKGKSKGFGFVTFTEHEHALAALRAINNNPEIFTPNQRPIVEFSLENRKALQAKEKRFQKSVENNKLAKNPSDVNPILKKNKSRNAPQKPTLNPKKEPQEPKPEDVKPDATKSFTGLAGKRGVSKLPLMKAKGKVNKNQAKISRKSLKGKLIKKKIQERRMREPKSKPKRPTERPDESDKLVSKYKQTLEKASGTNTTKSKWYS